MFVSAANILPLAVAADISEPTIKYNIPADCREKLTPCHIIAFMCSDKRENRAVIALNLFLGDTSSGKSVRAVRTNDIKTAGECDVRVCVL